MKKDLIIIPILIMLIISPILMYKAIDTLAYNSRKSHLEKYTLKENEQQLKNIKYENQEYILTNYQVEDQSYPNINILFKDKKNYYLLKEIKSCDASVKDKSIYIKDNEIYIHCIGKKGNINKYTINEFNILEETLLLNYKNVPAISELHVTIKKVDTNNIYINSLGTKAKCSFRNYSYKCEYYE